MKKRFVACVACSRHVREGDASCPFCGAAAPAIPPRGKVVNKGVSRAAMLAAGAAGGILVLVDCGDGTGNTHATVFYGVACTGDASCFTEPTDAGDAGDALETGDAGDGGTGATEGGGD